MIKTTIVFDYGTEEFAVTLYDQHVDPAGFTIEHRGTLNSAPKDWLFLSTHRYELRHSGQLDLFDPDFPDEDDIVEDAVEEELDDLEDALGRQLTEAELDEWVYGGIGGST